MTARTALLGLLALILSIAAPAEAQTRRAADPIRGMWVTRWDYLTQSDVRDIVRNCAELGITDLFWQVRGQADAYYRSNLEPWGEDLFRAPTENRTDPGFDPLALAVSEAKSRGLRIHAWMNMMPLWKGKTPPKSPSHPYHAKPGWRLYDEHGKPQALTDHYVIINPLNPDARAHVVAIARDLAERYDLDGVHMDYIRFVTDTMDATRTFPADAYTRELLAQRTGSREVATESQQRALRAMIREAITTLVREVRRETQRARDGVMLTAAVWRRPELARDRYEQDAVRWLKGGLIDAAIPMIYTDDADQYQNDLAAWRAEAPSGRIIPGVGVYKHNDGAMTASQLNTDGTRDFVLFAYSSLYQSATMGQDHGPKGDAERARRLTPLRAAIRADAQTRTPARAE